MDFGWRFAFGHPYDTRKDFGHTTVPFFFAKAGYGDGPAAADFDDRAWRGVNLPHDWAVELPFDRNGSGNHGSKAIGRNFPDTSVGWYRKTFAIPAADQGRRISVEFDGVYRDSVVWINGHYLGEEHSGYSSFAYDLTDYLNYGGANVIAVRVDATIEEGWFYEGAGVYRHVWLTKTAPLHVARYGAFVTSDVKETSADVTARVTVENETTTAAEFDIGQTILDAAGKSIVSAQVRQVSVPPGGSREFASTLNVPHPRLWSVESPHLHTLVTTIRRNGAVADRYETTFGIRTVHFDPNSGFFLNGKRVELKGTNNHQDHAGVGAALPDDLQDFRISRLKEFGVNAYRCSHNPPTPELLDACDRHGVLVIDEHRMMGTSPELLDQLKRLILRDRNHPSVILWSLGNEEWAIEGNPLGRRLTTAMHEFAKRLDPTRRTTVAVSGGWETGSGTVMDVMGYNYKSHGDADKHHAAFPNQPGVATEEVAATTTRGVYVDDRASVHLNSYDWKPSDWGSAIEDALVYYAARPFLAGMFVWSGFDYRGEPTPFGWPAIASQFGVFDLCGFPKDHAWYLKAWWSGEPMVHLLPHWNWPGKEGQTINVRAYSNADEVELFLNGKSLGRKPMTKNSHVEWDVAYQPGALVARAYKGGRETASETVTTTGDPSAIRLVPHVTRLKADGESLAVIAVDAADAQGRAVPTAGNEISFSLRGPGRIIGVGNGDPGSHEPDQYIDAVSAIPIPAWRVKSVQSAGNPPETAYDFDDSGWQSAFGRRDGGDEANAPAGALNVYRGVFQLPGDAADAKLTLLMRSLGQEQTFFLNGQPLAKSVRRDDGGHEFKLEPSALRTGKNVIAVVASPLQGNRGRRGRAAAPATVRVVKPAGVWKRRLFNGLAQVIVQSSLEPGEIILAAESPGLASAQLKVESLPARARPSVPPIR